MPNSRAWPSRDQSALLGKIEAVMANQIKVKTGRPVPVRTRRFAKFIEHALTKSPAGLPEIVWKSSRRVCSRVQRVRKV